MIELYGLRNKIKDIFTADIVSAVIVGSGISGKVYKVDINMPPYVVAVKTAKDGGLLKKESEYIQYIYSKVDIKLPKIYAVNVEANNSYMIMEYFDGLSCNNAAILDAPYEVRQRLSAEIADNIAKLQQVKGEKYGDLLQPQFDNWHDFYRPFVVKMLQSAAALIEEGILLPSILETMNLAYAHYDKIFDEPISLPTLIHGDYWAANIIADKDCRLIGVVDPFNAMWADSEYELFALNAVYGDKLPVLEMFLAKHSVSQKFGLKNEFYFLFSETYWVTIMKHDNNAYLTEISERFIKQLKMHKMLHQN